MKVFMYTGKLNLASDWVDGIDAGNVRILSCTSETFDDGLWRYCETVLLLAMQLVLMTEG